ncbi:MAG: hypothetical protein ACLTDR_10695 [Adlercreutzia equolifaciens]
MSLSPISWPPLRSGRRSTRRSSKVSNVADVRTQADFEKLPFSEKDDLRAVYPLGLQAVPDEEVVRIHSSSGTTGTPVIIPTPSRTSSTGPRSSPAATRWRASPRSTASNHPGLRPRGRPASVSSWAPSAWAPWPFPWGRATPRSS